MPRKVRDSSLETRTARSRLPVRHKPYFRLIEPGLHLGYRKLPSGPGTWIKRQYVERGRYTTENLRATDGTLILADDYEDADAVRILNFAQAQQAARGPRGRRRSAESYTVGDAMEDYLRSLENEGRAFHSINDTRYRAQAFILPTLGNVKLATLTSERLRRWRDGISIASPRLRTRKGEQQKHRQVASEDAKRARRATANRTWTPLRAALNHAFHEGKIDSDLAWRNVKPFRRVDSARVRYLSIAEAKRLINGCDFDFRPLVEAALQTGCRYGELCRLRVHDFNPDAGTLSIRQSKSGRARHVVLSGEARAFFMRISAGRSGAEPMFGKAWGQSHQIRRMNEACQRSNISPAVSFHALRHSWASHSVMNGMPLMVVARNLGHTDTRMVEKHYGHLAADFVADAIRKGAPRFGFKLSHKIVPLSAEKSANA